MTRFSLGERIVLVAAFLLMADLGLLPWHNVDIHLLGVAGVSFTRTAIEAPEAIFGILALLLCAAVVGAIALEKLAPASRPVETAGILLVVAGPVVLALVLVKWAANTDFLGVGCWLGILLAVGLTFGGLLVRRDRGAGG